MQQFIYGCRRIIQVDAAHWWWMRRHPPHNVERFECLEKSTQIIIIIIITILPFK